jgi:hypothetical protein
VTVGSVTREGGWLVCCAYSSTDEASAIVIALAIMADARLREARPMRIIMQRWRSSSGNRRRTRPSHPSSLQYNIEHPFDAASAATVCRPDAPFAEAIF